MGYFSNGTEGLMWDEQWCSKCYFHVKRDNEGNVLEDDEYCCPIIDAHMQFQKPEREENALDLFIVRDKKGFNIRCDIFLEVGVGRTFRTIPKNQLKLELEYKNRHLTLEK